MNAEPIFKLGDFVFVRTYTIYKTGEYIDYRKFGTVTEVVNDEKGIRYYVFPWRNDQAGVEVMAFEEFVFAGRWSFAGPVYIWRHDGLTAVVRPG